MCLSTHFLSQTKTQFFQSLSGGLIFHSGFQTPLWVSNSQVHILLHSIPGSVFEQKSESDPTISLLHLFFWPYYWYLILPHLMASIELLIPPFTMLSPSPVSSGNLKPKQQLKWHIKSSENTPSTFCSKSISLVPVKNTVWDNL